ncbi:hypothetical protein E2C01_072334 [Portunus trituberculatus]|uniref:Uncharacterized protein n=1 Tax=Portunus trituberculatus TaxID=210409 RepID=A0A5B7I6U5_PORTR|nr:hypothetical protein [Portunus trituberculatus]
MDIATSAQGCIGSAALPALRVLEVWPAAKAAGPMDNGHTRRPTMNTLTPQPNTLI